MIHILQWIAGVALFMLFVNWIIILGVFLCVAQRVIDKYLPSRGKGVEEWRE